MVLDISGDWAFVDHLESVTLKIDGSDDAYIGSCVISHPRTVRELEPTGAQVLREGTVFEWPMAKSTKPPIGSVVVDEDDDYWTVWRMAKQQHIDMWEVFCLDLSIVGSTDNQATLLRATYTKGDANESKAVWVGAYSGLATPTTADTVPARFQPSEETAQLMFGAENTKTTYRVYFDTTVPLEEAGGEYRLVDQDGFRYRVVRYINEGRIDKLPVAIAVRILEGAEYHNYGPPTE
jgi:hypothetical protein